MPYMSERPTLYLIDGSGYIYRAFFALPPLSTSSGLPTSAIYGFITMLQKVVRERRPDYLAVVFDEKGPTHRHQQFKEYKAQRRPMPDSLSQQIPYIHRAVDAFAIPVVKCEGFEADDLIGTLALQAVAAEVEVVIVTADKDMFQLLSPSIQIYDPVKDKVLTEEDCLTRFGVAPARVIEIMGLMGDSIDNIPGVKGIGEKTARKLIEEFHTIENLLACVSNVKAPKVRALLETHGEDARRSRELATLVTNCPVSFDRQLFRLGEARAEELAALFRELEFWGLLKGLQSNGGPEKTQRPPVAVIADSVAAKSLADVIEAAGAMALECEPSGTEGICSPLMGIGVCLPGGEPVYVPAGTELKALQSVIESAGVKLYVHDYKAVWLALHKNGVAPARAAFDTMLASYLLNPNRRSPTLEVLMQECFAESLQESTASKNQPNEDLFKLNDTDQSVMRAGRAASAIARLQPLLAEKLATSGLAELYERVELPLTVVLAEIEANGFRLDTGVLGDVGKELDQQLGTILQGVYRLAGVEFNVNSPKQLCEVLFEKLKLPPIKKTKTGYSTDEDVLTQLALQHELPAEILNYRSLSKLKSTYVDALPRLVNSETGRLHTSLHQTVTATGRLSSSDPNLQNIPIKGEWGRRIRAAFTTNAGWVLLSADYNQIEPRILAHLSQDPVLIGAYGRGDDIHTTTAMQIFGLAADQITKDMRRVAKTVNFGIIYGISPFGLSSQLGISNQEAKRYIDAYFARFEGVKAYIDRTVAEAKANGYVTTLLGRRRPIPELRSGDATQRSFGERIAMNSPIQGTAADVIKLAMLAIHRRLAAEGRAARILLQVHDELILELPEAEVDTVRPIVTEEMERVIELVVPLKVDIGIGKNWSEAHP
jgi:DNA polymerase I